MSSAVTVVDEKEVRASPPQYAEPLPRVGKKLGAQQCPAEQQAGIAGEVPETQRRPHEDTCERIPLLLDTGSDLVWVPCTSSYQCSNCSFPPAGVPLFSPKASSSAKLLGCRNPKCAWLHAPKVLDRCRDCPLNASAAAGCSRVCPPYVVVYGSGLTAGLLLSETMDVSERPGGDVLDFVVGCSIFSTHQPPAGVAGFGRGPASLPSQLGLRRFSYCLISRIYDDQEGAMGDVVLEGAAESSRDGLSFTPFLRNPAATAGSPFSVYYYLGLRRITVDGAKVRIPHAALLPLPCGDGGTIIDSGTTFTYMEPRVFEPVAWAVAAAAAGRYNRSEALEQLTGLRPCFRLAGGGNRLPQLTFHWKGGAKMRLPPANYFALVGDEEAACLTLMTDAGDAGRRGPSIILGSFQQQNYYVVYDLEKERLGLRQQSCFEDSG
ncbi:hypothetical protein Taro_046036 [Colocasia esculenta]|uniref:Peptidase A1 domain-containing protein n=1 Tax=Colocasia esculenta TaxID=4460 RepID=A0A843WYE6_COLES|nr:hypothetical protein [Colocasia esculenta]